MLFPLQHFAEEKGAHLTFSNTDKAIYFLNLAERRVLDLVLVSGTNDENIALVAMDDAFDRAESAIAAAPESDQQVLINRLADVVNHGVAAIALLKVVPIEDPQGYTNVLAKLSTIRELIQQTKASDRHTLEKAEDLLHLPFVMTKDNPALASTDLGMAIDPQLVSFPPGSAGAEHAFFPLIGEHSNLTCVSCHMDGQFAGTPKNCDTCHADVLQGNHYAGECGACHSPLAWSVIVFDHGTSGATDCKSCHTNDKPNNHYTGQCSACHNTKAWNQATFNHAAAGANDCKSCHNKNKPANHFSGQCSSCHNTSAWKPANFNHKAAGATDCQSCHSKTKPKNHFSGQCSNCHSTKAWRPASFDHSGVSDCKSCHNGDKPKDHFNGQCSNCHRTKAWEPASFDHSGQTDCQSCHTRPNGHSSGQCSSCHSTSTWEPTNFNHSGQTDCQSCHTRPNGHSSGQCSSCHNTNAWEPANFDHSGLTDCQSCHNRPNNHWSGQCSKCHSPNSWGNIKVNGHTFPINHEGANSNCSRCHPSNNANYTCYSCHDKSKMENEHAEEDISNISNRCAECHPRGDDD
jgi:hypothetical protein